MFTARTLVAIVALSAGGVAASSANRIDNAFSVPAIADEPIPTMKPAPATTASMPPARRVTAQK